MFNKISLNNYQMPQTLRYAFTYFLNDLGEEKNIELIHLLHLHNSFRKGLKFSNRNSIISSGSL